MDYSKVINDLKEEIRKQNKYIKYLECKAYCKQYEQEQKDDLPF